MPNTRKTTQRNGSKKLMTELSVLTTLLCKDLPQLFQTTTTESMLGLILKTTKLTLPSGPQKLLKSLKVDTTSPLKEHTEFQETLLFLLIHQIPRIITT